MDIALCKRSVSVGVMSLVEEASCRLERIILEVHMLRGFRPDGPLPTARGECLKKFVSGMGGVDNNLTCLRVLEACRSWRDGRLESIMSSAERMICWSLPLSLAVAAAYQMVMAEVMMDSMTAG